MTRLDAKRYRAVSAYAGHWKVAAPFQKFHVDEVAELAPTGCAVYIIEDALGEVDYVGSVCRATEARGVLKRLHEHLRDPEKRRRWHRIAVVSLRPDTPLKVVRSVEAAIGADLVPKKSQRLPRLLT
jgi:hypothetical protein